MKSGGLINTHLHGNERLCSSCAQIFAWDECRIHNWTNRYHHVFFAKATHKFMLKCFNLFGIKTTDAVCLHGETFYDVYNNCHMQLGMANNVHYLE